MGRKKVIKRKPSKFAKLLYTLAIILVVSFPVVSIASKAFVSKLNIDVEKLKKEVEKHEKTNQSLTMKINELASLENFESVAKKMGLSYTSNSIKTIED